MDKVQFFSASPVNGDFKKTTDSYQKKIDRITNYSWKALSLGAAACIIATGSLLLLAPATALIITACAVSLAGLAILLSLKALASYIEKLPKPAQKSFSRIRSLSADVALAIFIGMRYFLPTVARSDGKKLQKMKEDVEAALKNGRPNPHLSKTRPIILVHGYLDNSNNWMVLKNQLEEGGLGPIYTVDLGNPYHSIDTFASVLKERIELIATVHGLQHVSCITHSMGGLVAGKCAALLAKDQKGPQISDIAAITPPAQGTKIAPIGVKVSRIASLGRKTSKAAKQMQHKSPFIQKLNNKLVHLAQNGLHIYTLTSSTDPIIRSKKNCHFAKDAEVDSHHFGEMGHLQALYSPKTAPALFDYFKRRETGAFASSSV